MIPNLYVRVALAECDRQLAENERRRKVLETVKRNITAQSETDDGIVTHAACFVAGRPRCADEPPFSDEDDEC